MTLLDWFSQNPCTQLLLIWCVASYLFAWSGLVYVAYFTKPHAGKRRSKSKIVLLLLFAPIIVPYLLWIN